MSITFFDSDLEGCQHPHDDPLVVRVVVANKTVHRVLVDNGSSADIIFASAFDKMGIGREKLEPVNTHLRGFSGEKVLPLGSIQLVLTLGEPPCQATTTARFLIADAPSAYNMLLGRPSLNAIKAIPSAYHMIIKFPTIHGVGMVRGDQRVARECYTSSIKQIAVDNVNVDELDMRDEVLTRPEPSEELEPVSLDDDPEHFAYIGSKLAEDLKGLLTQFLRQNRDVFAWKQANMGGIDRTVITHRLNTSPSFKPVKQKRRSPAAHFDEFVYSGQVTLPEELDQLRLHRHSATSPLGCIAIRLERHQGHSARSPAAHFDEFVYSGQVTLPEELDQLRLHHHSATSPLGCIAIRLERHEGNIARSLAAHFDDFVYSGQVTLPEELDQLRLHRHSATSPFGWNATKATVPGAQQLTLTSSSSLDRSRYLRS